MVHWIMVDRHWFVRYTGINALQEVIIHISKRDAPVNYIREILER